VPVADWFAPSAVRVKLTVEETTPESASEQFQVSVTSVLFQPFAFAGVRLANVITGEVRSILIPVFEIAGLVFPALSVQVPDGEDCPAPSVFTTTGAAQVSRPERLSVPVNVIVTLPLFQLFPFGRGSALATTAGGVLSILIVTEALRGRPAAFVAEHVRIVPDVSVVRLVDVHPVEDVIPDSGSVTLQLTDTSELFQPLRFGEGVIVGTITGGVVSNLVMTSERLPIPSILTASNAAGFKPSIESTVGAICLVETVTVPPTATGAHAGYDTNSGTWVSFSPKPPCSAFVGGEGNGRGSKLTPSFMTTTISGVAGSMVGSGNGQPVPKDKILVQYGWKPGSVDVDSAVTAVVVSACT
jgi:hypothetical protein